MRPNEKKDKHDLVIREAFSGDPIATAAYVFLMCQVFDPAFESDGASPWWPIALFDPGGACAGGVETCVLRLVLDGVPTDATAIRLVAVAPDWRGLGLFRTIMAAAIAWCESAAPGPILLYTEEESLYTRFGFTPVAQHAFAGPALPHLAARPARTFTLPADRGLIDRLLSDQAAVSDRCAVVGPPAIFLGRLGASADVMLAYAEALDAVIVYELDDETIMIVDIVAAAIPSMEDVLAALPARPNVVTLFTPDRLGWAGEPRREDTGLMLRGAFPAAMRKPFMLPPTAEF